MKAIGVRELRQRASEYLRQVEAGRTFAVTAHGRPVAWLVPARVKDQRVRLAAAGRLTAGTGDMIDLGPPLPPAKGVPVPGELLRRARRGER